MATRPLTPQQQKFAQLYVELGNASEAYRRAYPRAQKWKPEAVHPEASRMLARPTVSAMVKQLRNSVAKKTEVTVESLIEELEEARTVALTDPRAAGAAVSASMGKGKLLGFIVEKHKVDANLTVQQLPPLTAVAAGELKRRIEAERF